MAGVLFALSGLIVGGVWFVLDTGLRGMEVAIIGQNERIGAVESSVREGRGELNARFDSQSATIEGRFNSLDERLAAFDQRFDAVIGQNTLLLADVRVLGEKLENLTSAVQDSGYVLPMAPILPDRNRTIEEGIFVYFPSGSGVTNISDEQRMAMVEKGLEAFRLSYGLGIVEGQNEAWFGPINPQTFQVIAARPITDINWYLGSSNGNEQIGGFLGLGEGTYFVDRDPSIDYGVDVRPNILIYEGLPPSLERELQEAGAEAAFVSASDLGFPASAGEIFIITPSQFE